MPKPTNIKISDHVKGAVKPLPSHLKDRYQDWQKSSYDADLCATLAEGQKPHSMIISCCDSRVNSTKFFNAENGEFFIHRNIANIVPVCDKDSTHHSTAAALEYAVTVLNIGHIIILGHSACGGIKGGFMQLKNETSSTKTDGSLQKWLGLLKPAYDRLDHAYPEETQISEMEKLAVVVSLEHLMTYDFIRDGVERGMLFIHGLWHDIGSGTLLNFNAESGEFTAL